MSNLLPDAVFRASARTDDGVLRIRVGSYVRGANDELVEVGYRVSTYSVAMDVTECMRDAIIDGVCALY